MDGVSTEKDILGESLERDDVMTRVCGVNSAWVGKLTCWVWFVDDNRVRNSRVNEIQGLSTVRTVARGNPTQEYYQEEGLHSCIVMLNVTKY